MSVLVASRSRPRLRTDLALLGTWALLLAGVLAAPALTHSANPGDDLTRHAVRLALAYYGVAAALMLLLTPGEGRAFEVYAGLCALVAMLLAVTRRVPTGGPEPDGMPLTR